MNSICPICLENLNTIKATTDACEHEFCFACLQTWSKHGNFCPVDRRKFTKIINLDSETVLKVKGKKRKLARATYDFTAICEVCKNSSSDNTLLLCDSCDLGYHCDCLAPPLKVIPRGRWHCPECVAVELRLRTNKGTPADTKYAKNVQRKRKYRKRATGQNIRRVGRPRKSSTNVAASTSTEIGCTTNAQNNILPGPSLATTSASNCLSLDDMDLDPEDIDLLYSDEENRDVDKTHQQEQVSDDDFFHDIEAALYGDDSISSDDEDDLEDAVREFKENFSGYEDDDFEQNIEEALDDNSAGSAHQDTLFESENSPPFGISNSDFESSSETSENFQQEDPTFFSSNYIEMPSPETSENVHQEDNCTYEDNNQNEIEDSNDLRDNHANQMRENSKPQSNQENDDGDQNEITNKNDFREIPEIQVKDVNTSKENADLCQDKKDMEDFTTTSSEDSNSMPCLDKVEDDLHQKEKNSTEETSSSSLDCGFSDYPEAIVLKLPLRLNFKRSTTLNGKGSSNQSSTSAAVQNINEVSASFCKISSVTSCTSSLLQNSGSESIRLNNENLDLNINFNKTNDSSRDISDNQVDNFSTSHITNSAPIIFSLIETKSSILSQTQCSYNSRKDKDPTPGQTHNAVENLALSNYARHFGPDNTLHASSLTVANKTSSSETFVRREFTLYAEESGNVTIPPNLSYLFKGKKLSAQKDGALFFNWRKHNS